MTDKPTASEAGNLMVTYYQHHPGRAFFHFLLAIFTGGVWGFWFVGVWFGLLMGWGDVEGIRELQESGEESDE